MRYPSAEWHSVVNLGYPPGTHGQLKANGPRGAFWHDAQGWRAGAESTFNTPGRGSAHIIFNLDGPPWQFVDFDDAAWHCGGYTAELQGWHGFANLFYWGFEFEGGFPTPEPITDYQIAEAVKCSLWLAGHYGFQWKAERHTDLWEHGEVYPTSCPNGRIPWAKVIAALKGEDAMTDADRAWVLRFSGGIKLIKGSGPTVYVVDHHGKRPFPGGPTEFIKVGFDWDDVMRLPDPVINAVPEALL